MPLNTSGNRLFSSFFKILRESYLLLRQTRLRLEVASMGFGGRIMGPVFVSGGKNIKIGHNVYIGRNVVFDARKGMLEIGDNSEIRDNARIYAREVRVGSGVTLGEGVFLNGSIVIGDRAWLARNCDITGRVHIESSILGPGVSCIGGGDHDKDPETGHIAMRALSPDSSDRAEECRILIKNGSWVGQNAIILKGVTIETGGIVGAGSVVTKNVPAGSTVVGNPARVIKEACDKRQ